MNERTKKGIAVAKAESRAEEMALEAQAKTDAAYYESELNTEFAEPKALVVDDLGVLPASADYVDVFPYVKSAFGFDDIVKAANFYQQYKETLDSIFKFFKALIGNKDNPKTVVAPPAAILVPIPQPVNVPSPVDGPLPYPGRIVTTLVAKPYWIGKKDNPLNHRQFDEVVAGTNPLDADGHTKLHLDISPFDQAKVEIGPGSPALAQLMRADGHPAIVHHCLLDGDDALANGKVDIGSVDDDYGCTPSLKPSAEVRDGKDHEMVYWASFSNERSPAGTANSPIVTIASNRLVYRVK